MYIIFCYLIHNYWFIIPVQDNRFIKENNGQITDYKDNFLRDYIFENCNNSNYKGQNHTSPPHPCYNYKMVGSFNIILCIFFFCFFTLKCSFILYICTHIYIFIFIFLYRTRQHRLLIIIMQAMEVLLVTIVATVIVIKYVCVCITKWNYIHDFQFFYELILFYHN